MKADGGDQQRLTLNQDVGFGPAVSPDCGQIAFEGGDGYIYVMSAVGSDPQKLADSWEIAWSPRHKR